MSVWTIGRWQKVLHWTVFQLLEKKFKDRPIYVFVFSPIKDDKAFMKAKTIYIKFDESILRDPLESVKLQSDLCVFDDIESLTILQCYIRIS